MNDYSAKDYDSFAAMDVHARSITVATLDKVTGEMALGRLDRCPSAAEVQAWVRERTSGRTLYAYESGPTKFDLCRGLRGLGEDCGVVAVTTLARSPKQRRQKTDAVDARALLSDISNMSREFSWCWVPSEEAEQARDLCRLYRSAAASMASARQAVSSFLLGRGIVWDERTPDGRLRTTWTRAYDKWLDGAVARLCDADASFLERLIARVDQREAEAENLRRDVLDLGSTERWRPYVDSISCLLGIGPETALLAAAEFDDFSRFRSGRRVRNWIGLAPSEHSSGEKGAHGSVTKGGPSCLRKCLIEGLASMPVRKTPNKSVRKGQDPLPEALRIARKGNRRLFARYNALVGGGKGCNKAKVAVAAEEACWVWRVGLEVQGSLG